VEQSRVPYVDFDREEVAEAFASTLRLRFAADPALRNADRFGIHPKTLGKWERGEDLPGFVTACSVLHDIDGWSLFLGALEGHDRDLGAAVDTTIAALDHAIRLLGAHPSLRQRRLADAKRDDVLERLARLGRGLKEPPLEDEKPEKPDVRLVPRRG